jgi:hypothetical protein
LKATSFSFLFSVLHSARAEKTQSIFGNPTAKTIDCCIDSPKLTWKYGLVWIIFSKLPKEKNDPSEIYTYENVKD